MLRQLAVYPLPTSRNVGSKVLSRWASMGLSYWISIPAALASAAFMITRPMRGNQLATLKMRGLLGW
jgi:hypothetical protein